MEREELEKKLRALFKPTPREFISTREGPGKKPIPYIEWGVAVSLLSAEFPDYDWEIVAYQFVEKPTPGWIVHGRLTVAGIDCIARDGIGYAACKNLDIDNGIKDAESDAFKRAATKFGIALDLYGKGTTQHASTEVAEDDKPVVTKPTHQVTKPLNQGSVFNGTDKETIPPRKATINEIVRLETELSDAQYDGWNTAPRRANSRAKHMGSANFTACRDDLLEAYRIHLESELADSNRTPPLNEIVDPIPVNIATAKDAVRDLTSRLKAEGLTTTDVWLWIQDLTAVKTSTEISHDQWIGEVIPALEAANGSERAFDNFADELRAVKAFREEQNA